MKYADGFTLDLNSKYEIGDHAYVENRLCKLVKDNGCKDCPKRSKKLTCSGCLGSIGYNNGWKEI